MLTPIRHRAPLSLAVLIATAPFAAGDVYDFRVVAESGDPAPGSIGGSFTSFSGVSINASGQIAFRADSTGAIAESGYWKTAFNNPQLIQLIVGQDYPVPNSGGQHFGEFWSSFYTPHLNDAGNVGFSAPVGDDVVNTGIFRMVNGSIETIALPGDPAPGAGPGVTFTALLNLIAFNDDNLIATRAHLAGRGVNASNDSALYLTWFGGFQLVAREGGGAPGLPGTTFGSIEVTMPLLGNNGQIAFDVSLNGADAAFSSRWRGWPGSLTCLVKDGDPTPEGGVFSNASPSFWTMSLSETGAAFRSSIETPAGLTPALWHASGGPGNVVTPLAVVGDLGPLGFYDVLGWEVPNTAIDGASVFSARFAAFGLPDATDSAILRGTPGGATEVLLREGNPAYGFGAGVVIDDVVEFSDSTTFGTTDSGWTLIRARVRGLGINDSNNLGLWTVDPDGEIHYIIKTGTLLSLDGQPARLVESIHPFISVGQQSGRRSSINERGDVALSIRFSNGDEAVVVAQLPDSCPGDLDEDGIVDATDLAILLGGWGVFGPVGTGGDVDRDGDTDALDLGVLLGAWGPCEG
ncbi:MAG: hypothetical protein JNL80_04690 [Phycisphaerae bacterium]|nr:hypothetical protein [Phycisphaerae bacterium]